MPGPTKLSNILPCPQIMEDLSKFLRDRGHQCAMIIGTNNHKFKWCGKDVCTAKSLWDDARKRDSERMEFANQLKDNGHTCVTFRESFPVQIGWCGQDKCLGSNN